MIMRTAIESWENEKTSRMAIDPKTICTFGIKCLDDVLFGILKKDFIVIGADSGIGKSQICLDVALHNARRGKKIGLYFIEGGDEEAIARIKWKLMTEKYYAGRKTLTDMPHIDMDYRKWRMNLITDSTMVQLEQNCFEEFKDTLANIMLYGYEKGLSIKDFVDSLDYFLTPEPGFEDDPLSYSHKVDLIIIDHLQYFNLTNPSKELSEQGEILKKVNEICHGYKIPVILVSHLRKKDKDRGLPSQEDFYGTSNTPKMSSIAITMSSLPPIENGTLYPTYFRFVKSRIKISPNYALLCAFDVTEGRYKDRYSVHKVIFDKPMTEPLLQKDLPKWAKNSNLEPVKLQYEHEFRTIKEEDVQWPE